MAVVLVFEDDVLRFICWYDQQCGQFLEKGCLCDELIGMWDMRSAGDLVMFLGDINGHIGRHID